MPIEKSEEQIEIEFLANRLIYLKRHSKTDLEFKREVIKIIAAFFEEKRTILIDAFNAAHANGSGCYFPYDVYCGGLCCDSCTKPMLEMTLRQINHLIGQLK